MGETFNAKYVSIKNPLVLHRITQLLFFDLLSKILLLVQLCQPDSHSIRVRLQPFPLSQPDDIRTQLLQPFRTDCLGGNVFLERKSVDARELTGKAVSGKGVVGTRGVITASI